MKKIYTKAFFVVCLLLISFSIHSQEYRQIDGRNNNQSHPEWGAANTPLLRMTSSGYANGIDVPGGANRPNARLISNEIFAQDGFLNDIRGLSDFTWVFGQFIDHDITFVLDGDESMPIAVPSGDPQFDPFSTGQVSIGLHRSEAAPGTGTSRQNPRSNPNIITAFIDASAVYGSNIDQANWLRSFRDGKMKTSEGNMLPFNTVNSELSGQLDPTAPHMDDPVGVSDRLFVAGDARANENPLLLAYHTLFVREHNRLCDELKVEHPNWNDERLYQEARKINGAILQSIVYNEWLPTMGVELPDYRRYNPNIEVGVTNVFSAAAFRLGHTLLNANLLRLDREGNPLPEGDVALRFSFFNPMLAVESGIEPFFQGMGAQIQQGMDAKVVDDVRNFLFGPPGAGGMDLAAINIQRGRERGLADYNTIRREIGLRPFRSFSQINNDPTVFRKLEQLYNNDINNIDAWVGMLAESPMENSLFGETLLRAMQIQFMILRDGDRFYFENDRGLSSERKAEIRETKMVDVLKRNTTISLMQRNVFKAEDMSSTCAAIDVSGNVRTESGLTMSDVYVELKGLFNGQQYISLSEEDGSFEFNNVDACNDYKVKAIYEDNDWLNGISTYDILMIREHILGINRLDSPYKIIAADVDGSRSLTTSDLTEMHRLILGQQDDLSSDQVWQFLDANYNFTNPTSPFQDDFDEIEFMQNGLNLIAIKTGDINGDAAIKGRSGNYENKPTLPLRIRHTQNRRMHQVELYFDVDVELRGFQFELKYDRQSLSLARLNTGSLPDFSHSNFRYDNRQKSLKASWVHDASRLAAGEALVTMTFVGSGDFDLCNSLYFSEQTLAAEIYTQNGNNRLTLDCNSMNGLANLYENEPNPFDEQTTIRFDLPKRMPARLVIVSAQGDILHTVARTFEAGENQVTIYRSMLGGVSGSIFYRLEGEGLRLVRNMVME